MVYEPELYLSFSKNLGNTIFHKKNKDEDSNKK